jgi:hypothetical protein
MVSTVKEIETPPPEPEAIDPEHRTYQKASVRGPALIVLGIAAFIIVAGIVASALSSGGSPTLSIHSATIPDGTVVHLTPAADAMHPIVSLGEPPADILGNLAVPAASPVTGTFDADRGQGQFDRTVSFHTGLSSNQVVDLYRNILPRLGWQVVYVGSAAQRGKQGTEVLGKHGSGDGFYWEVGVVVSPTTSSGTTLFSVELFQLADDN